MIVFITCGTGKPNCLGYVAQARHDLVSHPNKNCIFCRGRRGSSRKKIISNNSCIFPRFQRQTNGSAAVGWSKRSESQQKVGTDPNVGVRPNGLTPTLCFSVLVSDMQRRRATI